MIRRPDTTDTIPAWVNGELVPADKLEVHRRGLRHKAVSVFVTHGEEVLIQRRALGKYHTPGLWANTCCTHPAWGESPGDCAARRLREELGLTGLAPEFRDQVEYRAEVGGGMVEHEVVDIFLAETDARPAVTLNPEEVMDAAWISFRDLCAEVARSPERFTPWLRIYLHDHRDRIFGTAARA
jgi:isopentenyl-diphosphate delta-isomerase